MNTTIRRFITRYHPRAVRSYVYMLQASEYNASDYLRWVSRTNDFTRVEKRKQLRWTPKAMLLYAAVWAIIVLFLLAIVACFATPTRASHILAALIVFVPLVLPYITVPIVSLLRVIQWPVEQILIAQATKTLAKHPAIKIGIAGSYGKTSMREILRTVLSEGKRVAAPGGSENTPIAIARFVKRLKGDEEILIFEFGEYYPGDVRTLARVVKPQYGIITGVNEAHLEKFKNVMTASATIFELTDFVSPPNLYVNGESDNLLGDRIKEGGVVYDRQGAGYWKVVAPKTSLNGTSFTLVRGDERMNVNSHLLGLHQIGPLSAAAHIANRLELNREQIERGLSKTKPFAHRLAPSEDAGVITLDDSYNGNPDGVAAVIAFLAGLKGGRRFYVTPGLVEMGDRSEEIHKYIGKQLVEANIEKVILIRNSVTPWIEKGLKENNYTGEVIWFDDALTCYKALPQMTVACDVVLLQNDWPDQYA